MCESGKSLFDLKGFIFVCPSQRGRARCRECRHVVVCVLFVVRLLCCASLLYWNYWFMVLMSKQLDSFRCFCCQLYICFHFCLLFVGEGGVIDRLLHVFVPLSLFA